MHAALPGPRITVPGGAFALCASEAMCPCSASTTCPQNSRIGQSGAETQDTVR